jgi:hypothetical protein
MYILPDEGSPIPTHGPGGGYKPTQTLTPTYGTTPTQTYGSTPAPSSNLPHYTKHLKRTFTWCINSFEEAWIHWILWIRSRMSAYHKHHHDKPTILKWFRSAWNATHHVIIKKNHHSDWDHIPRLKTLQYLQQRRSYWICLHHRHHGNPWCIDISNIIVIMPRLKALKT